LILNDSATKAWCEKLAGKGLSFLVYRFSFIVFRLKLVDSLFSLTEHKAKIVKILLSFIT